jgi:hypothetical protein
MPASSLDPMTIPEDQRKTRGRVSVKVVFRRARGRSNRGEFDGDA